MVEDIQLQPLAMTTWQVAVIGAGPAGCVAAAILAGEGRRVLLVEKSKWPREKVCGGCLNRSAIQTIRSAGLGPALTGVAGARKLDRVIWRCGRGELSIPMPAGVAMLRSELDAGLAAGAERRGCVFLPGATATVLARRDGDACRSILLRRGDRSQTVSAEAVLACDGIGGTSVENEPWVRWKIARRGWIGVSATIAGDCAGVAGGAICMHVGEGGYVGLVRLSDGRVHLAAALNPRRCRAEGGPGIVIEIILASTGIIMGPALDSAKLRGTGAMTRRRDRLGGHRVLAVGDASGYVEPFTGEGMAWAVRSAALAAAMLPRAGEEWPAELPARWQAAHAAAIGGRQRLCRAARPIVRHPGVVSALIGCGSLLPWIGGGIASHVCGGTEQLV
ncbi:MAG TPA: NAD(P)/FAD-dependent oxidoreductase [Tepidisphaeraceae bacterium]|jgi:flavin-dependent dehydrogenase|nr:NAD(P)/FAD-dependent oxidoreductase [Tepidisphaeraceae bacterium]